VTTYWNGRSFCSGLFSDRLVNGRSIDNLQWSCKLRRSGINCGNAILCWYLISFRVSPEDLELTTMLVEDDAPLWSKKILEANVCQVLINLRVDISLCLFLSICLEINIIL